MSNKGAPSNWPPTFPRFLRNSEMTPAFQSLIVIDGRYIVTRRDLLTSNIEKLATWSRRDHLPQGCHLLWLRSRTRKSLGRNLPLSFHSSPRTPSVNHKGASREHGYHPCKNERDVRRGNELK